MNNNEISKKLKSSFISTLDTIINELDLKINNALTEINGLKESSSLHLNLNKIWDDLFEIENTITWEKTEIKTEEISDFLYKAWTNDEELVNNLEKIISEADKEKTKAEYIKNKFNKIEISIKTSFDDKIKNNVSFDIWFKERGYNTFLKNNNNLFQENLSKELNNLLDVNNDNIIDENEYNKTKEIQLDDTNVLPNNVNSNVYEDKENFKKNSNNDSELDIDDIDFDMDMNLNIDDIEHKEDNIVEENKDISVIDWSEQEIVELKENDINLDWLDMEDLDLSEENKDNYKTNLNEEIEGDNNYNISLKEDMLDINNEEIDTDNTIDKDIEVYEENLDMDFDMNLDSLEFNENNNEEIDKDKNNFNIEYNNEIKNEIEVDEKENMEADINMNIDTDLDWLDMEDLYLSEDDNIDKEIDSIIKTDIELQNNNILDEDNLDNNENTEDKIDIDLDWLNMEDLDLSEDSIDIKIENKVDNNIDNNNDVIDLDINMPLLDIDSNKENNIINEDNLDIVDEDNINLDNSDNIITKKEKESLLDNDKLKENFEDIDFNDEFDKINKIDNVETNDFINNKKILWDNMISDIQDEWIDNYVQKMDKNDIDKEIEFNKLRVDFYNNLLNKKISIYSNEEFPIRNEKFYDNYSAREKKIWIIMISLILLFIITILWSIFSLSSIKWNSSTELDIKNKKIKTLEINIKNLEWEVKTLEEKVAEKIEKSKLIEWSGNQLSLSVIDKILIDNKEDMALITKVYQDKYLSLNPSTIDPKINSKIILQFNDGRSDIIYRIKKKIVWNNLPDIVEQTETSLKWTPFIIISSISRDWYFIAEPLLN